MSQAGVRNQPASKPNGILRKAWSRREPVLWAAIVALALVVRWPALKGWYFGEAETPVVSSGPDAQPPSSGVAWRTDFDSALAEARATNKRVLVDISASWCPPCIAMKHEVWPDAEVARTIEAGFVPLIVDADTDRRVSARYRVESIPTVLLLDADGLVVKRNDGFLPKSGMLRFLNETAD